MKKINIEKKKKKRTKNLQQEQEKRVQKDYLLTFFWLVAKICPHQPSGLSFLEVIPILHAKEMQELAKSKSNTIFSSTNPKRIHMKSDMQPSPDEPKGSHTN